MEKIVWVRSYVDGDWFSGKGQDTLYEETSVLDGLSEVNQLLQEGWRVKSIVACPVGEDSDMDAQAYAVLEKGNVLEKKERPNAVFL